MAEKEAKVDPDEVPVGLAHDILREEDDEKAFINAVEHGVELKESVDADGNTLLHLCVIKLRKALLKSLLNSTVKLNFEASNKYGQTALHIASQTGDHASVHNLLLAGCNPNHADKNGNTSVHLAAASGHELLLECLVLAGGDLAARDAQGRTPLHGATYNRRLEAVRWLLGHGADQSIKDDAGAIPLHFAAMLGDMRMVFLMVRNYFGGLLLGTKDSQNRTPARSAQEAGHTHMARTLEGEQMRYESCCVSTCVGPYKPSTSRDPTVTRKRVELSGVSCCGGSLLLSRRYPLLLSGVHWYFIIMFILAAILYGMTAHPGLDEPLWIALLLSIVATISVSLLVFVKNPGFIVDREGEVKEFFDRVAPNDGDRLSYAQVEHLHQVCKQDGGTLCTTCANNRPRRAKHCPDCQNCITRFDHHCPWVSTCVGDGNHREFVVFLICILSSVVLVSVTQIEYLTRSSTGGAGMVLSIIMLINALPFFPMVLGLTGHQLRLVYRNLTTNELINWRKYAYLNTDGVFNNQLSQGCCGNCLLFWCHKSDKTLTVAPISDGMGVEPVDPHYSEPAKGEANTSKLLLNAGRPTSEVDEMV